MSDKTPAAKPATQPFTSTAPVAEAKPATKPVAATADTPQKKPAQMYIGPNLPGGKLSNGTLYKGGEKPAHVLALIDECPALKFLFVTPQKLAQARQALNDPASVEAAKYTAVRKHFYKGAN